MAVNVQVVARRRETTEDLIKRFSRKVRKEKIMEEFRERMYYEKPSDKRRRLKKRSKAQTK
jgi:small subunit ribosomal protein S21